MSLTSPRRSLHATPAVTLAAPLAATVLVAAGAVVAPAASAAPAAASRTATYTCDSPQGALPVSVAYDWDLPDPPETVPLRATYGKVQGWYTRIQLSSAVPGALAKQAADLGATTVDVVGAVATGSETFPSTSSFGVADVALEDQTVPRDVDFETSMIHWIWGPGEKTITADDPAITLTFQRGDGSTVLTARLDCQQPGSILLDTVRARSTSTVRLIPQGGSYVHGQSVALRAEISVVGTPSGWVDFTLDGVTQRAAVSNDGVATTTFQAPTTARSPHQVTTSFVPSEPQWYEPSSQVNAPLTIVPADTTSSLRVTGPRADRRTKVRVRVDAAFESSPTGTVRVDLRRLGTKDRRSKTKAVGSRARVVAGFGKLRPGRYKVVVKYRGDVDHLRSRKTRTFRVRR